MMSFVIPYGVLCDPVRLRLEALGYCMLAVFIDSRIVTVFAAKAREIK